MPYFTADRDHLPTLGRNNNKDILPKLIRAGAADKLYSDLHISLDVLIRLKHWPCLPEETITPD